MEIFAEKRLSALVAQLRHNMKTIVEKEDRNYLLNVNETQYIAHLTDTFQLEPLVLYMTANDIQVSDSERMIPAERFPHIFHAIHGKSYPKQVITYRIPFTGDKRLLNCQPSQCILWSTEVQLQGSFVCFDIINWNDNPEEIKSASESIRCGILQQ